MRISDNLLILKMNISTILRGQFPYIQCVSICKITLKTTTLTNLCCLRRILVILFNTTSSELVIV